MPDTAVELDFADGKYRFWLPLPCAIELERNCGSPRSGDEPAQPKSLFTMYDQFSGGLALDGGAPVYLGGGAAILKDVREVIRLGLIGGNCGKIDGEEVEIGPIRAKELVETYCFPARPFVESLYLAWSILHAAIVGIDLKKKASEAEGDPPLSEKDS